MSGNLSDEEIQYHAERIGDELLQNADFSMVYEDEDLEDLTEEEHRAIFDALVQLVSIHPSLLED